MSPPFLSHTKCCYPEFLTTFHLHSTCEYIKPVDKAAELGGNLRTVHCSGIIRVGGGGVAMELSFRFKWGFV